MSTNAPGLFDFPAFTRTLSDFPKYRLSEVERELMDVSDERDEDVAHLLRRRAYKVELQRLHAFLRTGEIPADMTPHEEEAYETLLERSTWMD